MDGREYDQLRAAVKRKFTDKINNLSLEKKDLLKIVENQSKEIEDLKRKVSILEDQNTCLKQALDGSPEEIDALFKSAVNREKIVTLFSITNKL